MFEAKLSRLRLNQRNSMIARCDEKSGAAETKGPKLTYNLLYNLIQLQSQISE